MPALIAGGTGVIVALPETIAELGEALIERGIASDALVAAGRLVIIDAATTLAAIQHAATVDPYRFSATIEATLRSVVERAEGQPVHAVSELASMLATRPAARARLEELWRTTCDELGVVTPADPGVVVDRMQKLLELGNDLAAARSREEVIARMLDQGMHAVDAAVLSIWSVAGLNVEIIGSAAVTPGHEAAPCGLPLLGETPVAACIRTGEAVFLRSPEAFRASFPVAFEMSIAQIPFREFARAVVPMVGSNRVLGALCFTYPQHREFTSAERAFKAILARQCALAFERLDRESHERQLLRDAELLNRLISTLNRSDSAPEVFELALETVEHGANSERAAILLFDQQAVLRFHAHHGLSARFRAVVESHAPWLPESLDPAPVIVEDVELDPAWAPYLALFRAEGIRSLAFVPLVHRQRTIGELVLYRGAPGAFTARELEVATTTAHHVALAVERSAAQQALARAFAVERAAHLEAEQATRAREEIISVVSHDLRSPLSAILMGAGVLVEHEVDRERVESIAGKVLRQAERMARLVDDLVDFAAIQSGHVALARALHPPQTILEAAIEMFALQASERGVALASSADPSLPGVECDSGRAVQVISNLVANALKVTPSGGTIEIGAKPSRDEIVFFVKDSGPGIPAEDQPKLFERFWRGTSATYRGAGLGLSIARGIVDAHGGRIWVESTVGQGSTFYFSLST